MLQKGSKILSVMNLPQLSYASPVDVHPAGAPIHSYVDIGHVLCHVRTKAETWATKDDSKVSCKVCLQLMRLRAKAA